MRRDFSPNDRHQPRIGDGKIVCQNRNVFLEKILAIVRCGHNHGIMDVQLAGEIIDNSLIHWHHGDTR